MYFQRFFELLVLGIVLVGVSSVAKASQSWMVGERDGELQLLIVDILTGQESVVGPLGLPDNGWDWAYVLDTAKNAKNDLFILVMEGEYGSFASRRYFIKKVDPSTGETADLGELPVSEPSNISFDFKGDIWVAAGMSLYEFDGRTLLEKGRYEFEKWIDALAVKEGAVFLISGDDAFSRHALEQFDPASGSTVHIDSVLDDPSLQSVYFMHRDLEVGPGGELWLRSDRIGFCMAGAVCGFKIDFFRDIENTGLSIAPIVEHDDRYIEMVVFPEYPWARGFTLVPRAPYSIPSIAPQLVPILSLFVVVMVLWAEKGRKR